MGELSEAFLNLEISDGLFKDIRYYISGRVHEKIDSLLRSGGAEQINYFSDYVTHLIVGDNPEENDISDAREIYEIPTVTPKWVLISAALNKKVDTKHYLYTNTLKLFSNLVFSFSHIGDDRFVLWTLITYNGGLVRNNFNKDVNCLITGITNSPKYLKALSLGPERVKIVTPDWLMEAVRNNSLPDPVLFHPKLINWPPPPTPRESTIAITGFESDNLENQNSKAEKTDVADSTQALLEKLKQNMAPSLSSDPVAPPNVVAPSFLNKTQDQSQPPRTQYQNQTQTQLPNFQSPETQSPRTLVHHTPNQTQPVQNPLNIERLLGSPQQGSPRANLQQLRGQLNTSQIHQQLLQQRMQLNPQNLIQRGVRGQLTPQQQQMLQQQLAQRNQQLQSQLLHQNQPQLGQNPLIGQQNQFLTRQNQLGQARPLGQQQIQQGQSPLLNQQQANLLGLQQRPGQSLTPQQRLLLQQQHQQSQFLTQQQQNQNQLLNQQQNQDQQDQQSQLMNQEQDLSQHQDQFSQQQTNQGHNQQTQLINQQNQDQILGQEGQIQQQDQQMINQQSQTQQILTSQANIIQNQHLGQLNSQQMQQLQQLKREQQQLINQSQNQQQQMLGQNQQQIVGQQSQQQLVNQNQQQTLGPNLMQQQLIQQNRVMQQQQQNQQNNQNFNQQILQQKQMFSQQQVQTSQQQNMMSQQGLNIQQQPPFVSQSFSQHQVDNLLQQQQQQPKLITQQTQMNVQALNQQLTTQNLGQQLNQQQLLQQQQQQQNQSITQQLGMDQNFMTQQGIQQQMNVVGINPQVIRTQFSQANINQQGDLINQQANMVNQQGGLINQQGGLINQQGGLVNQQAGLVNQQSGLLNQQGGILNQQGSILNQQSGGLVSQQGGLLNQQGGIVNQSGGMVNQQQSPIQGQRPQLTQQLWGQQQQVGQQIGQQIQGQQIIQRPVGVVQQQQGSQPAGPRLQWAPGQQQQSVPQRQFIQLDAQTHNQLQKMPPEQQALFVAKLQARQRQLQFVKQQMQQRGGGQILIRGNVPPGLTAQQQVQWLQQQAKQQGIVLPPNIQQNITPGTLTPQSPQPQQQSPVAMQPTPGLSPINSNAGQQFNDPNQQQQQIQLRQYRLQQLQLQREQAAQKNALTQQVGALPQPSPNPPSLVRPTLVDQSPPLADSTTNSPGQVQVNSKTRSALANMLSIKLQSGGTIGQTTRQEGLPEPSAAGTLRMMTAQHNAAINSKPQEIIALQQQRRVITAGQNNGREIIKPTVAPMPLANQSEPPKLQFTNQKSPLPVQHRVGPFYGHNPNLKLPPDLFLLGCIFVVVEIEDFLEEKLPGWQQKIEKYGGEVEKQYCNKVTHVLCETQRHGVVMQALRDCKRCVTIRWLSDVIQRKQVLPPWTALHLPQIYLDVRPASKHLISISGFEGNTRNMVKQMIQCTGAKCTTYFSKHNTLLICARNEGKKYSHAKKWCIPVVNVQWLTDVMLGNFQALNQMDNQTYQTYSNPPNMSFDPKLVPNIMHAWKAPINISQESYERVKRSASPVTLPKAKKQKTEHIDENENITDEHMVLNSNYKVLFSQFDDVKLKELSKMVRELGGAIAKDYRDFTHLVMPSLLRSHKLLFAICRHVPILSEKWIENSHGAKEFLPENGFDLDMEEFNMKYKVNLEKTFQTPNRSKMLEGKFFWVTPSVFPSKNIICDLIEFTGGTVERIRRSRAQVEAINTASPLTYFILTTKEDLHLVADLLRNKKEKQKVVCNVELILSAILRQQFEVDPFAVTVM